MMTYQDYIIKELNSDSIDQIIDLQSNIMKGIENPEIYYALTHDEFSEILSGHGYSIGIFNNNVLIAYGCMYFPVKEDTNLAADIDLKANEFNYVAQIETIFVHKDYRKDRLQLLICHKLIDHLIENKEKRHVLSSVSPLNYASVCNLLSADLPIVKLKSKYNNYLRYIFHKDLSVASEIKLSDTKLINIKDYKEQIQYMDNGYVGFESCKQDNELFIRFGKLISFEKW
jgi:hypothetical protein